MKKIYLVTLAPLVFCGVHVPTQAQSSVTLFGNIDTAVGITRSGAGTTTAGGSVPVTTPGSSIARMDSGIGPGSRLGVKGAEDLGGGLKADLMLEAGFATDSGALQQGGLLFGRQSYVGLSSNSGWAVTAGRQYSPLAIAFALSDATGGNYWGNPLAVAGHGLYESLGAATGSGFDGATFRVDNAVQVLYKFGGFTAKLMVAAGNENTSGTGRFINPALAYENGRLKLNFSYARFRQNAEAIIPSASPENLSEWIAGGSYDFGVIKIFSGVFQFNAAKNTANLSAAFKASAFAYTWDRTRTIWLSGVVPFGTAGALTTQLSRTTYHNPGAAEGTGVGLGLLYEYPLSRRTKLYASYGRIENNAYARGPLFATITAVPANGYGADPSALSLGIQHSF